MISNESIVKLIKKLETTDISGEKVMIDFQSGKYFMLKGVANDIWDYIQKDITVQEIINNLLNTYEVQEEECKEAVYNFLTKIGDYGFISMI